MNNDTNIIPRTSPEAALEKIMQTLKHFPEVDDSLHPAEIACRKLMNDPGDEVLEKNMLYLVYRLGTLKTLEILAGVFKEYAETNQDDAEDPECGSEDEDSLASPWPREEHIRRVEKNCECHNRCVMLAEDIIKWSL